MRLCTHAHMNYTALSVITEPNKAAYAARYGYEFRSHRNVNQHMISWERVDHWISSLPGSGWLFHSGCDAAITNPSIKLEQLIDDAFDFIICCDGNGFNADSWIMKENENTITFLNNLRDLRLNGQQSPHNMKHEIAHEQDGMTLLLSGFKDRREFDNAMGGTKGWTPDPTQAILLETLLNRSPLRVKILPQRWLNAYPLKYYKGHEHLIDAQWSWKPGDFVAHMPGNDLDVRVRAFKEMLGV